MATPEEYVDAGHEALPMIHWSGRGRRRDTAPVGRPGPHPAAVAWTTEEARQGRSAVERAAVRDPTGAVRRTAEALAQGGPERERRMRRGFESAYQAFSRRDWELNTLLIDSEEYVFRPADLREALPDFGDEYHGVEGYLEAQELLLSAWTDLRLQLVDILAVERDQAITLMHWTGHNERSGISLDWRAVGDNRFRDGLAVAQTYWFDRQRAARDLGLQRPAERP